jgi:2-amino-4-hydroxy-6-hydroxymethyldihydropteridine diphosphokinase
MKKSELFLSIGTNLGNRQLNIDTALNLVGERIGIVLTKSSIIETEPWGFSSENLFYNIAVKVETELKISQILFETKRIEKEMGRTYKSVSEDFCDRIIDLDLIFFDNLVLTTQDLCLPHPKMTERLFVLQPMAEIAPNMTHPVLGKTIKQLLIELQNGRQLSGRQI